MISHLYELQRPSNFLARPFLVPTKPFLLQRKLPHSLPSLSGSPSSNPQLSKLSLSYNFHRLITPQAQITRGDSRLTPAVESSPQDVGFTTIRIGQRSFFSPSTLVNMQDLHIPFFFWNLLGLSDYFRVFVKM